MSLASILRPKTSIRNLLLYASWPPSIFASPVSLPYSVASKSNPLGIDWDPAPPANLGPPFSANASRNRALLPAQISGIVGAYVLSVFIVGVVLLFVVRKSRLRVIENGAIPVTFRYPDTELRDTRGDKGLFSDPSPNSPLDTQNFAWSKQLYEQRSPVSYTFPLGLGHSRSESVEFSIAPADTAPQPYIYPAATFRVPLEINTNVVDYKIVAADKQVLSRGLEDIYAQVMEQEELKAAGVDVKSMPPPRFPMGPIPGEAPQRASKLGTLSKHKPQIMDLSESKSAKSKASALFSSLMSPRSRKNKHALEISSPIMSPLSATFSRSFNSDEEPLSPRFYAAGPAPPVPGSPHYNPNISPTRSIDDTLSGPSPDRPKANPSSLTLALPEARSLKVSLKDTGAKSPDSTITPKTSTYTSRSPTITGSAVSGTSRTLPFRQFEPSSQYQSMTPDSTKTTVLERTDRSNGPRTGGLATPWSAGAVPYSPYQPFTPMMPVTPRLITKDDRKAMKKAMRAVPKTPITEMVMSDEDTWY